MTPVWILAVCAMVWTAIKIWDIGVKWYLQLNRYGPRTVVRKTLNFLYNGVYE